MEWLTVSLCAIFPLAHTEWVGWTLRSTPGLCRNVLGSSPMQGSVAALSNTGCSAVTFS